MTQINTEELMALQSLLSKLEASLGNRIVIMPSYLNKGCYLGLYNRSGILLAETNSMNLETAYKEIKKQRQ